MIAVEARAHEKVQETKTLFFVCETKGGELREAMTMNVNKRINECARTLNDGKILAKLSGGDVVALELKYHPACLVALYKPRTRLPEGPRARECTGALEESICNCLL